MKMKVWHESLLVGDLRYDEVRKELSFKYSQNWLSHAQAFPLSVQLPLQSMEYVDAASTFFANLLPEAKIRELLSRSLGISEANDYEFLRALGGDCAGAFVIAEKPPLSSEDKLQRIHLRDIKKMNETFPSVSVQLLKEGQMRLSLAGAQDKIAVRYKDGSLFLPQQGTPSSHILKFPGRDYKNLIENEFLFLNIAKKCGLNVPHSEILEHEGFRVLLVERYDRSYTGGKWNRLHQEDFCQALGFSSHMKYQKEGGPTLKDVFQMIQTTSVDPVMDIQQFIQWIVFNVAIGNCDHHAKNLSLLRTSQGWRLSPFYDLLCTKYYPSLSKEQAQSIGGQYDGGNLNINHWKLQMKELDYSWSLFLKIQGAFIELLEDEILRLLNHSLMTDPLKFILKESQKSIKRFKASVKS